MGIFLIKFCMLVFMYSVIDGQKISKNNVLGYDNSHFFINLLKFTPLQVRTASLLLSF